MKCLILTPLLALGKEQRLQSKGGKLENSTQISPVVFRTYSVLQKRTRPQVQMEVALSGNARLHLLGSSLIHICASNLF